MTIFIPPSRELAKPLLSKLDCFIMYINGYSYSLLLRHYSLKIYILFDHLISEYLDIIYDVFFSYEVWLIPIEL